MQPCIYIMTNRTQGVLYVGVTSDLVKRVWQHREGCVDGFTDKYNLHKLVYYEIYQDMYSAISREKQLKNWKREWKIDLIENYNSSWDDLYSTII